jgi:hypothetical protein
MDNRYQPHDGDYRDWPTEEMAHVTGPVAGQWGHAEPDGAAGATGATGAAGGAGGAGSYQAGGSVPRRRLRQAMAAAAGAALLCGGVLAGTALAGGSSPSSSGPTGQAAVLNTMLSSASSPASAAATASAAPQAGAMGAIGAAGALGSPAAARCRAATRRLRAAGRPWAARAALRACGRRLRRLRVLAGIHGQFTFETKNGPRTLKFERGVVVSVSATAVVVRAQDGTTWAWDLVSNTVVRQDARRAATSALSAGQHVFVGGPVTGGANDARLIVIRARGGG